MEGKDRIIRFRIFTSLRGHQREKFEVAAAKVQSALLRDNIPVILSFEYLTHEDIRTRNLTEKEFVNYFLECDVFVFLTHPGQGQVNRPHNQEPGRAHPWNIEILLKELQRLKEGTGYPYRDYLDDPAFTQDKFHYIQLLPDYTIPTLRISLSLYNGNIPESVKWEISKFMDQHFDGNGWVLKLPFTTNSQALSFPKDLNEIKACIKSFYSNYHEKIHYAMLQPRLVNRKEYKHVFMNGTHSHVAKNDKETHGHEFFSPQERKQFAETIMSILRSSVPHFLAFPLVRLDIMWYKGNMVLNEIESLEANWEGVGDGRIAEHLEDFWHKFILHICNLV